MPDAVPVVPVCEERVLSFVQGSGTGRSFLHPSDHVRCPKLKALRFR